MSGSAGRRKQEYWDCPRCKAHFTAEDFWNESYCPMNRNGKCEIPTAIDIRPDGVCQKAIDFKPNRQ
jgi:hypothetical protein